VRKCGLPLGFAAVVVTMLVFLPGASDNPGRVSGQIASGIIPTTTFRTVRTDLTDVGTFRTVRTVRTDLTDVGTFRTVRTVRTDLTDGTVRTVRTDLTDVVDHVDQVDGTDGSHECADEERDEHGECPPPE
jgi:hypothetical protein